jgi:hypothetical protein
MGKGQRGQGNERFPFDFGDHAGVSRAYIEEFIKKHAVKSVIDAGSGDWGFSATIDCGDASYLGIDIASDVVEAVTPPSPPRNWWRTVRSECGNPANLRRARGVECPCCLSFFFRWLCDGTGSDHNFAEAHND